jgi:hypothetical protein
MTSHGADARYFEYCCKAETFCQDSLNKVAVQMYVSSLVCCAFFSRTNVTIGRYKIYTQLI